MALRESRRCFVCRHCGTLHFPEPAPGDVRVLGIEEGAPACPACRVPLATATMAGRTGHYCQRCRGLLLDRDTFVSVVQSKRAWARNPPEPPRLLDPRELEREAFCPRCGTRMATHPYHGPGSIVIDTCDTCDAIWLDHGELDHVVDAPGRDRGSSFRGGEGGWPHPAPTAAPARPASRIDLLDLLFSDD